MSRRRRPSSSAGRARRRPRRSRRSPTTPSSPTATPARSSRPTGRSTGCACRAFDAPSVFGSLLDREAGSFRLGAVRDQPPDRARLRARHQRARHDVAARPAGWVVVRDALTMGPRRGEDTDHAAHPPAGRRRRRAHAGAHGRAASTGSVEVELVCEPAFDYGRAPGGRGRCVGDDRTRRRRDRRRPDRCGCSTDMALGIEGSRVRAPACAAAGEQLYCALSWAEDLRRAGRRRGGRRADRRDDPLLAHLARTAPASPTTAGASRSSARRSRSRA